MGFLPTPNSSHEMMTAISVNKICFHSQVSLKHDNEYSYKWDILLHNFRVILQRDVTYEFQSVQHLHGFYDFILTTVWEIKTTVYTGWVSLEALYGTGV